MKIKIKTPNTPYETVVDSGVNEVTIENPYLGVKVTNGTTEMSVCARDDCFEIRFNDCWYTLTDLVKAITASGLPERHTCDGCGATENVLRYENSGAFLYVGDYMFLCNACLSVLNSVAQTRRNNA